MKSGYDEDLITDWSFYDSQMENEVTDCNFAQTTFHALPSLRALESESGWFCSKPYHGEEFDPKEWRIVPGGWDHEHCKLCFAKIIDGMSYWANGNEVVILCDRCFDHYRPQLQVLVD